MSTVDIYLLYHKDNKEINYVGSTIRKDIRFYDNHSFISNFGHKNTRMEILDTKKCKTNEEIHILEQSWINKIKPNCNKNNPHPATAIKYKKKVFNIPNIKLNKDKKEIIVYPKNRKKYGGYTGRDKKLFRCVFTAKTFKYYKCFKTFKEADEHRIEIAKKNGIVKNLLYLKIDSETKKEYYEMELQDKTRTKIDISSYDLVDKYIYTKDNKYVIRGDEDNTGKRIKIFLHNELCETEDNESVDHINRNSLDNRLNNLRSISKSEQCINRNTPKNNTSGTKGVSYNKINKRWEVLYHIGINKKQFKYFKVNRYKNKNDAYIEACICRHNIELTEPYYKNALDGRTKYEIVIED